MSRQPNPITRQIWGIEPRSPKRRTKLILLIGLELVVYVAVFAFIASLLLRSEGWPQHQVSLRMFWEMMAVATGFAGFILALRLISRIAIWDRLRRRLHDNWQEWHLSEIAGRQMLFGLGSPAIVTAVLITLLHLGACAFTSIYFFRDRGFVAFFQSVRAGGANADMWSGATALLMIGFALLIIQPLNMAGVAWGWGRPKRVVCILLFVFIGPLLIATVFEQFGVGIYWPVIGIIEIASWIPRGIFAWWLPFRAARVLDEPPRWIE